MSAAKASRIHPRRIAALVFTLLLPLYLGGWSWRWLSGPQSTIDVEGPVARAQTQVFYVTLWVTGIIFVIVASVLTYATLKFKARNRADEHAPPPPQSHGNPLVELSLIAASVLALVFIAVPTLRAIWYQYDVPEDQRDQAVQITATGYQWWFKFEYTQEQIDGAGPLVTANELVIPAGRPVRINLRTTDVIHSFWVPKLAGKVDMIPNRGNHLWLHAERPGYYWGQCAEYCGESHAVMRFRVVALEAGDYARWIAGQKHPARTPAADDAPPRPQTAGPGYVFKNPGRNAPGYSAGFDADPLAAWKKQQAVETGEDPALVAHGRELFRSKNCITCHTTRGHDGVGVNGPDLTHIGARTTIAGGLLENTPQNLHRWIAHPDEVKPGNKMWVGVNGMAGYVTLDPADNHRIQKQNITVTDDEARALVSYLHSLK